MAEPTTFPEEYVHEPIVYRRISGFAVAGLILAGSFALYLVIAGAMGFYEKTPLLLSPAVITLPVLGAVLSLVGWSLIRRSEGTLAGTKLAACGSILGAVSGLGYAAYYGTTYFAVRQQAETYTLKWFEKVKGGKTNEAFVDTIPPAQRQNLNAANEEDLRRRFNAPREMSSKGLLDSFQEQDTIRFLTQAGPLATIEPLGVKDWDFKDGGYKLQRLYRIRTPEGILDAVVGAFGSESRTREFAGRQWYIVWNETHVQDLQLSILGKNIQFLRREAGPFLHEWFAELIRQNLEYAFLDTQEPSRRDGLHRQGVLRSALAMLAAVAAPSEGGPGVSPLRFSSAVDDELNRQLFLPQYYSLFRRAGLLITDKLQADDEATRKAVLNSARGLLGATTGGLRMGRPRLDGASPRPWKLEKGRLVLPVACRLPFELGKSTSDCIGCAPGYTVHAIVTVECDSGSLDQPIPAGRKFSWRIVNLELLRAEDNSRKPTPALAPGADRVGSQ